MSVPLQQSLYDKGALKKVIRNKESCSRLLPWQNDVYLANALFIWRPSPAQREIFNDWNACL